MTDEEHNKELVAAIKRLKADLKRGGAVPPGDMTGVLTADLRLLLHLANGDVCPTCDQPTAEEMLRIDG